MSDLVPFKTTLPKNFIDFEGKSAIPSATMANTRVAIRSLGLDCKYDTFHDRYSVNGSAFGGSALQLSDAVARKLRTMIRLGFEFDPGVQNTMDALYAECEANQFHPVLDYLDGLKWDGTSRLDTWLIKYMGAEDTAFNRAVSRLILIAAVRRMREPGAKFDCVMVLESPEGYGKSSALAELFGRDVFTDQTVIGPHVHDKELQEVLRGRWCVEIAELAGMRRGELDKIKSMITRETDRARPAYGRATIEVPRSMVLIGTTNDREYLRALSGENRRFLPVAVGRIDIKALIRDRDQLWAEASSEEEFEPSLALPEKLWADASLERASRTQRDPWADVLDHVAEKAEAAQCDEDKPDDVVIYGTGTNKDGKPEERVSSSYVLGDVLNIPIERRTADLAKRAGLVMRSLGWTGPKMARINGKPERSYVRTIFEPWD